MRVCSSFVCVIMQSPMSIPYLFLILYLLGAFLSFLYGLWQTVHHKNPYALTPHLLPYGIFVWGDAVVLGFFWSTVSLASILTHNLHFFLVVQAVFWMVRSSGEIVYWLLQQFSSHKRDLPHTLLGHTLFPGESIWFAYQLFWQVVLVISSVILVYLLQV